MKTQETRLEAPAVVRLTRLEIETLAHIKNALKGAIEADHAGGDPSRKLAGVRFVTSSLQRYVERLFALEEHNGYMTELAATHPHLLHKVNRLRKEHDALRGRLREIVIGFEVIAPHDAPAFDTVCNELLAFIAKLDRHTRTESELLEDAYLQDTGGEGGL